MSQQHVLSDEKGKYTFHELKDWTGTGRMNLHRHNSSAKPHGAVTYYPMRSRGNGVTVGEIFDLEVKKEIEEALSCVSVLTSLGLPTNPEELRRRLVS